MARNSTLSRSAKHTTKPSKTAALARRPLPEASPPRVVVDRQVRRKLALIASHDSIPMRAAALEISGREFSLTTIRAAKRLTEAEAGGHYIGDARIWITPNISDWIRTFDTIEWVVRESAKPGRGAIYSGGASATAVSP